MSLGSRRLHSHPRLSLGRIFFASSKHAPSKTARTNEPLTARLNNAGAHSVTLNSQLMKKNTLLGATLASLVFAAAPLFAQTSTSTTTSSSYIQSSSIVGSKIKDSRGQDVGEIKDVVLDRSSGCL